MMQFETYRWEDHVPRKGGWKFNLVAGVLALGLIAAALPEKPDETAAPFSAVAEPAMDVRLSASDLPRRDVPVGWFKAGYQATLCPTAQADS